MGVSCKGCPLIKRIGVEVEGGGERNGMEGIVVGIVGNNEGMLGNGGRLSCGSVGMVGMLLLGSGGKRAMGEHCPEAVLELKAKVEHWPEAMLELKAKVAIWRAARLMLMLERVRARRKAVRNDLLEAIAQLIATMKKRNCQI
ncbi:hypothetical protein CR513_55006, partial [Mucuna pruriens]